MIPQFHAYRSIVFPVLFFILVIVIAHLFRSDSYQIHSNTISELAAQHVPNAWIMRVGFIGFGIWLAIDLFGLVQSGEKKWVVIAPFILYAICIALTGIWSTNMATLQVPFHHDEAKLHSLYAAIAGFALTGTMFISIFTTSSPFEKAIHFGFCLFVILFSLLFSIFPDYQGIFQRLLYASSFIWMIVYFPR